MVSRTAVLLILVLTCFASGPFGPIDNGDRPGSDLPGMPIKVGTAVECSASCWNTPQCKSWGFDICTSLGCWLKSTKAALAADPCRQSGVITTHRKQIRGKYGNIVLGDMWGGDMPGGAFPSQSATKCQTRCAGTIGCTFFSFDFCNNICYLKSGSPTPMRPATCFLTGVTNSTTPHPVPPPTVAPPPPVNPVLKASDPLVNYVGRYQVDGTSVRFDWAGVQVRVRVTGTSFLDVSLNSAGTYEVLVNGQRVSTITMNGDSTRIVDGLNTNQWNDVVLYRNNEPAIPGGGAVFQEIRGAPTASFMQVTPKSRRIEVIGDSKTCGYGVLGPPGCGGNGPNGVWESAYNTYVRMIADRFNADASRVSWSGRGMVWNCCGDRTSPVLPQLWRQTLGLDGGLAWDFNRWRPDAIIVNLGTNDKNNNPPAPIDLFTNGYVDFINTLRNTYGQNIPVFCVCGGQIEGEFCDAVGTAASRTGAHYVNYPWLTDAQKGCDGHPNVAANELQTSMLGPVMAQVLGW